MHDELNLSYNISLLDSFYINLISEWGGYAIKKNILYWMYNRDIFKEIARMM